jgi:hypothetical protein
MIDRLQSRIDGPGRLGHIQRSPILYIQRLPQRSDSAVAGPVGIRYDSMSASTLRQVGQSDHTVSVWQARKLQ